jgi:thiol-disulfide isomerase/thioredoxin
MTEEVRMVPVLVAAVILIGAVGLLNLLLTVGVIRRLRQHAAALSRLVGSAASPAPALAFAGIGQAVGEFSTATVDGQPMDHSRLSGETLVGFFSPHCERCKLQLPDFIAAARSRQGGPDRVLAAVVGAADEATDLVAALQPVARVVVESHGGPLGTAFGVTAYPTVVTVAPDGDGRVVVVANRLAAAG